MDPANRLAIKRKGAMPVLVPSRSPAPGEQFTATGTRLRSGRRWPIRTRRYMPLETQFPALPTAGAVYAHPAISSPAITATASLAGKIVASKCILKRSVVGNDQHHHSYDQRPGHGVVVYRARGGTSTNRAAPCQLE